MTSTLRLVDVDRMMLKRRTHFFPLAAKPMRQILVDRARRQHAEKPGGLVTIVSLDDMSPAAKQSSVDRWTTKCWRSALLIRVADAAR